MKKRSEQYAEPVSFDDFMAHPEANASGRSVADLVTKTRAAKDELVKKNRQLKKEHHRRKRVVKDRS